MRLAVNIVHGFRSKMASGGDNGNLVQEFEEAFQVEMQEKNTIIFSFPEVHIRLD